MWGTVVLRALIITHLPGDYNTIKMGEFMMDKNKNEDVFLRRIASKICKSKNVQQATEVYIHILEISSDHIGENVKNDLLTIGQATNVDVKL